MAVDVELPQPRTADLHQEFGVTVNLPFSVSYVPPPGFPNYPDKEESGHLHELYRTLEETDPSITQLTGMMRTDGQARALYRLITLPLRSALRTSKFVPAKNGEKEAEFIEKMLLTPSSAGGMTTPFYRVVAQMLRSVAEGFSAHELVYQIPSYGPLKGKVTLQKMAHRPSNTLTFLSDSHGDWAGFRQRTFFQQHMIDVPIYKNKAIYYAVNEEERPFYGLSYFTAAFPHYDAKTKLLYLAHLSAQHHAVGTRIGKVPAGASEYDKGAFRAAIMDFGLAHAIMLPPQFEVDQQNLARSFDYINLLNFHNSQMSKSVLATFLDDSQGGGASLVDFGENSDAMFLLMLQTLMDEVAAKINNELIPRFIQWNFNTDAYPTFTWGQFTDEQKKSLMTVFNTLAAAGQTLAVTKQFMFELEKAVSEEFGFEIDYDKIEAEQKAQADAASGQNSLFQSFLGGQSAGGPPEGAAGAPGTTPDQAGNAPKPDMKGTSDARPNDTKNGDSVPLSSTLVVEEEEE